MPILNSLFWGATAYLVYTYLGYPLLLVVSARLLRRPWTPADITPPVSLVIAAWNEAGVIRQKLENALALDYPAEQLEIVVASDGSDDQTVAIAREFAPRGVRVLDLPRGGKTAALNRAVQTVRGEVLVFSDANVFFEADALRKLVRHFADPQIGGVSGDVRLRPDDFTLGESQGAYYRYERFIQRMESALGSIIGADGGMYAMRRALFQPIAEDLINDDFILSMGVPCRGSRLIYDPEAIAHEDSPLDAQNELGRKTRVEHGNFQSLFRRAGVPGWRQPALLGAYLSHKVLRWTAFGPLIGAFGSSVLLAGTAPFYGVAAAGQTLFYLLALLGWRFEGRGGAVLTVPFYFVVENLAAARGLVRTFTGHRQWGKAQTRARAS